MPGRQRACELFREQTFSSLLWYTKIRTRLARRKEKPFWLSLVLPPPPPTWLAKIGKVSTWPHRYMRNEWGGSNSGCES
jgi:hypothetical protein